MPNLPARHLSSGAVRVLLLGVLVVAAVAIAARAGAPGTARAAADDDIDVVELDLVDATRSTPAIGDYAGSPRRELPTTVYLPATDRAAPLIVLAHGFNGHPRRFTTLARHWAQAGYVVAVPRFPVSSDEFPVLDPAEFNARVADLPAQADDVTFVIGELMAAADDASSALAGRIDPEHLGLYGMSLGSLTVWSTVSRMGFADSGVDALIQSDGGFPGDLSALSGVTFPVFIAHSDVDQTFPAEGILREFDALPAPKFLLVLHGAVHAAVGEDTPTPADEAYRLATTIFWDRYLRGLETEAFPDAIVIDGITTFVDAD
jgi:dienelactone hydrolase